MSVTEQITKIGECDLPSVASLPMWLKRAWGPPGCSSNQFVTSKTIPLTAIHRSSFLLCFATSSRENSFSGILKLLTSLISLVLPGSSFFPFTTGPALFWACDDDVVLLPTVVLVPD